MILSASSKVAFTTIGVLGLVFCMLGGVLFSYFPTIFKKKVAENLVLSKQSESFKKWQDSPVPVYVKFYLFNVTNPNEFNEQYGTPSLSEVGPYVFRVFRKKDVLDWDDVRGRLTYRLTKGYLFERDMSVGDMSEKIYTINAPYVGLGAVMKKRVSDDLAPYIYGDLGESFRNMSLKLVEQHSVHEMLFGGYYVDLLDFMSQYAEENFGIKMKPTLPNNTFGLFYGKNNSEEGVFDIGTGSIDSKEIGQVFTYNNVTELKYWRSNYCNMINGSDGSQFKPGLSKTDSVHVFSADLCRSITLTYEKDSQVEGIETLRFHLPEKMFAEVEENRCFCLDSGCMKAGVLPLGNCRNGSPVMVSPPHFYQGAPEYAKAFKGLKPEKSLHETFVDIEPTTGLVLNAARRIQMNVLVSQMDYFYHLENVTTTIFPIAWLAEEARIDPVNAGKLKSKVFTPMFVAQAVLLGAIVLGALALIASFSTAIYFISKRRVIVGASAEVLHQKH